MTLSRYKNLIVAIVVIALSMVTALAVGKIYVDMNTIPNEAITASEDGLREDPEEVKKLYQQAKAGGNPGAYSAIELYQIAEYQLSQMPQFLREMTGTVISTGVPVALRSQKIKVGTTYASYKLSPSKSVAGIQTPNVCSRYVYDTKNSDRVGLVSNGTWKSTSGNLDASFASGEKIVSLTEFKEMYQCMPTSFMPYIISNKTISQDNASAVKKNDDGTYSFSFNLSGMNLKKAAYYYSYEIKNSSFGHLPSWKSATISVTIDSEFRFKTLTYKEDYTVFGAPVINKASVTNDFVDHFYYTVDEVKSRVLDDFTTIKEVK